MFCLFSRALRAFGVWLISMPRALRSQEAAPPLGSQWSSLQGCSVKNKIKNYTVHRNSPAPCQTRPRNLPLISWNLDCAGLWGLSVSLPSLCSVIIEKLDLILLGFPWFSSMIIVIILNKGQLSHWLGKGEKHLFFWWQ